MTVPDTFVEEVRQRTDIVDVVSEYVALRRSGRSYVGLCPFHNERTPSFSVSADRGMYYCFGCGAGGTVFRFLMDIEGLPFVDAVIRLAERAQIPVPFAQPDNHGQTSARFQRMKDAHELAAKLYSYILMNTVAGVQALTYLEGRGISREAAVEFRLGYAPPAQNSLVSLLRRRGFEPQVMLDSGLAVAIGKDIADRFRGRLMIPIADVQGNVVAFGGRTLLPDGKPKYLNSPETPLFHKGELLFNLARARREVRKSGEAVVLEGYMDVLSAWWAGVHNCVATLGTSFSSDHAVRLKASAARVVIAYDGDAAGRMAAAKALDVAEAAGLQTRIVLFPEGLDPDDYVRRYGADGFRRYLHDGALTPVEFLLNEARAAADLTTEAGRMGFLRQALALLAERGTPIERDAQIRRLAVEFNLTVSALSAELAEIAQKTRSRQRRPNNSGPAEISTPRAAAGHIQAGDRILQFQMLHPQVVSLLMEWGVDELATPEQTALLALLYNFRAAHPDGDAASFIDGLEDDRLRGMASALLMQEVPQYDEGLLASYLRTIRSHHLQARLLDTAKRSDEARRRGDEAEASALGAEVDALASAVAELKMPQMLSSEG